MEAHQLPSDCYPPTDSDDESFVVLAPEESEAEASKVKLFDATTIDESLEEATEAIMQSLTIKSLPAAPKMDVSLMTSISSTASTEELQQKIENLMEENRNLSDLLAQNNIVMKSQCEKLLQWQADVERVHESHKAKFAETKDIIKRLQQENMKLKFLVRSAPPLMPDIQESSIKKELETSSQLNEEKSEEISNLKAELAAANDQNAKLKAELSDVTGKLNSLVEVHTQKVFEHKSLEASREFDDLKDELLVEMNRLETKLKTQGAQLVEFNELKTTHEELKNDLEKSHKTVEEFGKENQAYRKKEKQFIEETLKAMFELTGEQHECKNLATLSEILIAKIKALQDEIKAQLPKADLFDELKLQSDELKKLITKHAMNNTRLERENNEFLMKEQKLLNDVTSLKCKLFEQEESMNEVHQLRFQLQEAQALIVSLKEAKKIVDMEAAENRKTVDDLNLKLKHATHEGDKSIAMEEQLKLYQQALNTERGLKSDVISELNTVSQDLATVQQRNRELIEEIEYLRTQSGAEFVPNASSQRTPTPPLSTYSCPLCSSRFRSVRAVEEHVEMCINNNP